jgi:hypothetical protein
MLREKLPVCIHRIRAPGALPLAVFRKLCDAGARLSRELAFRVSLEELPIPLDGVGGLRGPPVLLLAAARRSQGQQDHEHRKFSCAECEHHRHPRTRVTRYSMATA